MIQLTADKWADVETILESQPDEVPLLSESPLLSVRSLNIQLHAAKRRVGIIRDVSFEVNRGETVAILGESGSGKTMTGLAIMGILNSPPLHVTSGEIWFGGRDLLALPERSRREVRGAEIGMVFQDSLSSLNPVFSIGFQIAELFRKRQGVKRRAAMELTIDLLNVVGIPNPRQRVRDYPHQFSGGMRQRVMIAMAIALNPKLLIADEPTTALDVSIQKQIMDLLTGLCRERGMGLILITHDLGVVGEYADRAVVMYAGRVVEDFPSGVPLEQSAHPYTRALYRSLPSRAERGAELQAIPGSPPDPWSLGVGCAFAPRCNFVHDACLKTLPPSIEVSQSHFSACLIAPEVLARD